LEIGNPEGAPLGLEIWDTSRRGGYFLLTKLLNNVKYKYQRCAETKKEGV